MGQGVITINEPFEAQKFDYESKLGVKCDTDKVSDGYHTFGELYEHRHALFLALMRVAGPLSAWYAMKHSDGNPTYPGWILCGVDLPEAGMVSYHLPERLRPEIVATGAEELKGNGKWDGHTAADVVDRLKNFAGLHSAYNLGGDVFDQDTETEAAPEQQALDVMKQALDALNAVKRIRPSRQNSIVITELETAIFWHQEDMRIKEAPKFKDPTPEQLGYESEESRAHRFKMARLVSGAGPEDFGGSDFP